MPGKIGFTKRRSNINRLGEIVSESLKKQNIPNGFDIQFRYTSQSRVRVRSDKILNWYSIARKGEDCTVSDFLDALKSSIPILKNSIAELFDADGVKINGNKKISNVRKMKGVPTDSERAVREVFLSAKSYLNTNPFSLIESVLHALSEYYPLSDIQDVLDEMIIMEEV